MASPAPTRKPGHHSTTYTLAPPPPPPNWSQTPTPGITLPYPYSYPQPAQTMPHHLPAGGQPPPRSSPAGPRRGSTASSTGGGMPPPRPLGLPENRDFFSPPTVSGQGHGKVGGGRVTPQNDPHRRGMYIPGSSPTQAHQGRDEEEGSESGDEQYGLEDDPWGDERQQKHRRGSSAGGGGIIGAVANLVTGRSPRSGQEGRMTSDEIEREAERAREESRREAERILAMERAARERVSQTASERERETMEAEVLALLQTPSKSPRPGLPLTPLASSAPPTPGTPSKSPNTSQNPNPSWWTAAKARLTPSKDPKQGEKELRELTPAQLIAAEARGGKLRRSRSSSVGAIDRPSPVPHQGGGKGTSWFTSSRSAEDKDREREKKHEWPAKGDKKFDDPAFALLNGAASPAAGPPTAGPGAHEQRVRTQSLPPPRTPQHTGSHLSAPGTPAHQPAQLSPHPPHQSSHPSQPQWGGPSPAPSAAPSFLSYPPSRSPYLSHTPQGALNVPDSLLSMASRLEKLERWTVAHVRALEDRMREVEEYIVGREAGWDEAEQGVRALRSDLEELRTTTSALKAGPPVPEDTELGRAINSAWRKDHALALGSAAGGEVPKTRESRASRVVSSVKSSDDDLRAMAQAQRAEVASKPHSHPHSQAQAQAVTTTVSNITRSVHSTPTPTPAPTPAQAQAPPAKDKEYLQKPQDEEDRLSLTGLADTLTDYSKMFLSADEGGDVSRNTSLARSDVSGGQDSQRSGVEAHHGHGREQEEDDETAEERSIASDATEAAHSLHSGTGSVDEPAPRTPSPTGLRLPAKDDAHYLGGSPGTTPLAGRGHLSRPSGDYATSHSPKEYSPALKPAREERDQAPSPAAGRKRYTTALGGGGAKDSLSAKKDLKQSTKDKDKEDGGKSLLPTPDTPGTEKFEPSPEKVQMQPQPVRPRAQRAHTTSYSVSSTPAMPLPSPAPSSTSANGNATSAGQAKEAKTQSQSQAPGQGEFFTTTRPRPRPHSTYAPLTAQSPAPIKIPPTHARPKQVGLGFVDPLVIRKEVKDAGREVRGLEGLKAVRAGKKTAKVGEMVKFFDKAQE